jgi:hypothetical protein
MASKKRDKWYDNVFLLDLLIILGSFLFLAIAALVFYYTYPVVMATM